MILIFLNRFENWANQDTQAPKIIREQKYIEEKIDKYVNICKNKYYLLWIVIDNDTYYFPKAKTYNENSTNKNKSVSFRELNPFLLEEHSLDKKCQNLLSKMDTGKAAFYPDVNKLAEICPSAFDAFQNTNKPIKSAGFAITKSKLNKVVFLFALTAENIDNNRCSRADVVNHLEELSIFAKRGL